MGLVPLLLGALAALAPAAQADVVGTASGGGPVAGGTASAGAYASASAASGATASIPYPDGILGVSVSATGGGGHTVTISRRLDLAGGQRVTCSYQRALASSEFAVAVDFSRAVLHLAQAPTAACDDGTSLTLPDTVTWTSTPGGTPWVNGASPTLDYWCLTEQEVTLHDNGFGPAGVWVEGTAQASTAGAAGPSGYGVFWYIYDADVAFGAHSALGVC